jgi:hypothetical protein
VRPSRPPSPKQRARCVFLSCYGRVIRPGFSAARWELAMLRKIQVNDLALNLNVLAVCAVFAFVGAVLLRAF